VSVKLSTKVRLDMSGLKRIEREFPKGFQAGLRAGALSMLAWANAGSPRESRTPPIRWGILRGSSVAFVAGQIVGTGPPPRVGTIEPAPSAERSGRYDVQIVWNVAYATRMHEWAGNWGDATRRARDAGPKWAERHVDADSEAFTKVVAAEARKRNGG